MWSNIRDFYKHNIQTLALQMILNMPDNMYIKKIKYRCVKNKLAKCGTNVSFSRGVSIPKPETVSIGDNVSIGNFAYIDSSVEGFIQIGNNCLIAPFSILMAADHIYKDSNKPIREQGYISGNIIIEDDCWLGAHVTVTKGVTIGEGTVIGANSVVTHDIPAYSVAVGVPAKVIKIRK